jgi:hypothetical protein
MIVSFTSTHRGFLVVEPRLECLAAGLFNLVQALLCVFHVNFKPQQTGKQGLGKAGWNAKTWEGGALTATTAYRRVHTDALAPAAAQASAALIASSSLIRNSVKHYIVKVKYIDIIFYIIHTRINSTTLSRLHNKSRIVPFD